MADLDTLAPDQTDDSLKRRIIAPLLSTLGLPRPTPTILDPSRAPVVQTAGTTQPGTTMRAATLSQDTPGIVPVLNRNDAGAVVRPTVSMTPNTLDNFPQLPDRSAPQYNPAGRPVTVGNVLKTAGLGLVGGAEAATDFWNAPKTQAEARYKDDLASAEAAQRGAGTASEISEHDEQIRNLQSEEAARTNPKPEAGPKVAFHYPDASGNETAVFEDGTTKTFPGGAPAKPEDIKTMYAQAVDTAQKAGKDPTTDPGVQRLAKAMQMTERPEKPDKPEKPTDEENTISDYLAANKLPNTPANRLAARTAARTGAPTGPGGEFDRSNAEAASKDVTTARGGDFRFRSMNGSYPNAVKGDQQAMLNLLTNHIGMTLGMQKGARITKDILNEAQKSAPWLQGVAAKFDSNGYLSGVTLTKGQMDQMMTLATQQRSNAWAQAIESARQAGVGDKVQIPADVRVRVTGPDGKPGTIPGGKLSEYEDHGYVVAPQ